MNPLAAHLERFQKQPPLIKEEEEAAGAKKRPFSNCVLFVLLAVFVFFLACLAVYTAVAMGIPVEKNEAAPIKSELSSSKVQALQDSMIYKTNPMELNKNVTKDARNESVIISNPSRLRIQIFIKAKDAEDSRENFSSEQNKTEETIFNNIPKNRIFLRRIIIHNDGLAKPEIDSSEEVSSGSDENMKEVLGFKPFGIANAPNPLEMFFNLLKLTEAPFGNIFNILEKQKNKQSNTSSVELTDDLTKNDKPTTTADQVEDFDSIENQINEEKSNQSEKISSKGKSNEPKSEKQEILPVKEKKLNPINLVNDAQRMISSIKTKQYDENMTPVIRYFRFTSPERQENYPPMYQRHFYQHPNPFPQSVVRLPYSPENMANRGSFNGGHETVSGNMFKPPTTMTPTTAQTTIFPEVYSTTQSDYSVPLVKNNYKQNFGETVNQQHKETKNHIATTTKKQEQPGMIDRIDTDSIKPFEDFFKFANL